MEPEDSASRTRITQACDTCRARKIKCDRKTPCSGCSIAQINCRTTKRAPEKKRRIHVSASYEKEVQGVNERLASLEKTIHTLAAAPRPRDRTEPLHSAQPFATPRSLDEDNNDLSMSFEGASSFTAHSKQTSQAFQLAASEIQSSVDSFPLSPAITVSDKAPSVNIDFPPRSSPRPQIVSTPTSQELPPMGLTLSLLRFAKVSPLKIFSDFPSLRVDSFSALCQRVYFPTEDYSRGQFALFNCGIYFCWAGMDKHVIRQQSFNEAEIELSSAICKRNLEELTRTMPLAMDDHSFETIQAITLMACYFLDTSRPSLSWKFASAAVRLCQDAGYHCLQKGSEVPDLDMKVLTFWHIFSLDRNLSLKFGRSPTIQDYDVTCTRPEADLSGNFHDSAAVLGYIWVELAFMQGEMFAQLYSNRAQLEPAEKKIAFARSLGARLQSTRQQWLASYDHFINQTGVVRNAMDCTDLIILSNLVLIYRTIPSHEGSSGQDRDNPLIFCEECITTSRTVLETYNSAWERHQLRDDKSWEALINWTYLYSPFSAFLVIFGTVISFRSEEDMRLLERSIKILASAAEYSQGVHGLLSACDKFYQYAKQYMFQPVQGQGYTQDSSTDHQMPDLLDPIEWDNFLNEWAVGMSGEDAREMSNFLSGAT